MMTMSAWDVCCTRMVRRRARSMSRSTNSVRRSARSMRRITRNVRRSARNVSGTHIPHAPHPLCSTTVERTGR